MNKTTKLHKYAILWLHSQGYSLEDISKEVKLNMDQTKRVISTQSKTNKDPMPETNDEPPDTIKNSRSKNLMITDSSAKKFKVAIMTKDASMLNDELKKNTSSTQKNTQNYIYRPDHE